MAKTTGLGHRLYAGAFNLSGDINSVGKIAGSVNLLDSTDITQSAVSRIGGLRDASLEYTAYFDPAAGASHAVLSALPTTDVITTYGAGTTLGDPAASMVGKQMNYDGERGADGAFMFEVEALSNGYGLEWGRQGTAGIRTDTTATAGTSIDDGAAIGTTNFGLQMYVHLFSFTGTSVTIKVQSSTDNGGGDAFADVTGATTAALTAVGAVRIATGTTAAVERYLKVTTTGTFTNAQFVVNIVRNTLAPTF